jgi:hypothetical protein
MATSSATTRASTPTGTFRPLFTLAKPGSPTVFPNPDATDVFINSAF